MHLGNQIIKHNVYDFKRVLDHPFRDKNDLVPIYRLVADEFLTNDKNSIIVNGKRYLKKECVVHHIDFNKENDNPDNLYVFDNQSKHILFHNLYGYRVNSIEEFETYYNDKYTNKILNYNWLYTTFILFGLSLNKISELFDIPYKSIESQVKIFELKKEKEIKDSLLIKIILDNLTNENIMKIFKLLEIPSKCGVGELGSSEN